MPSGDTGSPTGWGDSRTGTPASGSWIYNSSSSADSAGLAQGVRSGPDLSWQPECRGVERGGGCAGTTAHWPERFQPNTVSSRSIWTRQTRYRHLSIPCCACSARVRQQPEWTRGCGLSLFPKTFDTGGCAYHRRQESPARASSPFIWMAFCTTAGRFLSITARRVSLQGMRTPGFATLRVTDNSFGWGDAQGDAAQGFARARSAVIGRRVSARLVGCDGCRYAGESWFRQRVE